MGSYNRKSPDHSKPMPKVNFHHHPRHTPAPRAHGKTTGHSNRMPTVFYVIFLGAVALLGLAAISH